MSDRDALLKLIDFGFATFAKGNILSNRCGTPYYMAPEIHAKQPYGKIWRVNLFRIVLITVFGFFLFCCLFLFSFNSGKSVDMWSFGVILYILLSGEYPFHGKENSLREKIKMGQYKLHGAVWDTVSGEVKDLIRGLLTLDPVKRLTVEQALDHEWIKQTLINNELPEHINRLKRFEFRKLLRKITNIIIALQNLTKRRGIQWKHEKESAQQLLPVIRQYKYFTIDAVKEGEKKMFFIYNGFHRETRTDVLLLIYDCSVMTQNQIDSARYEYQLVKTHLQHPNIVRYDEIIEENEKICIVMEHLYGEELFQRIQKRSYYSEEEGRQIAKKMLQTIKFMHDKGIIHR
jgi:serine/threonine protein kinase